MTKQAAKSVFRKLLVVVMALANASCAATPTAMTGTDVVDSTPKYAAVVQENVSEDGRRVAQAAQDQADETVRTNDIPEFPTKVKVRLRRLKQAETTREHGIKAREILNSTRDKAFGSDVPFELDGKFYVARIEHHYHEPGGQARPWGWHRGISLFAVEFVS